MKDLYIIGSGGFGKEVVWLTERINAVKPTWNIKGFIDDNNELSGTFNYNYKILGNCEYLNKIANKNNNNIYAICAVGSANIRKKITEKLSDNIKFATLIDPSVIMSDNVEIGYGSIICAGTIITVDIKIGKHVIINLDCTIGHDDIIHDYVTIYPSANISGNVEIGECCEIGTGTQIIQGKNIIADTIIGAGSLIAKNIEIPGTYVGIPTRKIK